jgi:hypothetical protein
MVGRDPPRGKTAAQALAPHRCRTARSHACRCWPHRHRMAPKSAVAAGARGQSMWLSRVGRGPERLRLARNSSFVEVIKGLVEGAAVVHPSDWVFDGEGCALSGSRRPETSLGQRRADWRWQKTSPANHLPIVWLTVRHQAAGAEMRKWRRPDAKVGLSVAPTVPPISDSAF